MGELRLGIVGAGAMGRLHADVIRQSAECRLDAIADPSPQARDFAAERGASYFPDLADMLDAKPLDGVIVASPNAAHSSHALACIQRGLPVLIEKPIAGSMEDAARIVAASDRMGIPVLVGHHRRHNPILAEARRAVADGEFGRVATVAAFVTFLKPDAYFDVAWRRETGGGPILINLIHAIDDLRFLCGEIDMLRSISSMALRGFPVPDSAVVALRFASGALGTITLSDTAAAPWSWELTSGENPAYAHEPQTDCYFIAGTEGSLAIPTLRSWRYGEKQGWNEPLRTGRLDAVQENPLSCQLAHFCAVLRGETAPLVSAADASRTLAATLAVSNAAGM